MKMTIFAGFAAMMLLSACQNTGEGLKEDTSKLSNHITNSVEENRTHDQRGY